MKRNSILIAFLLISTAFITFLLYMNNALTHQIEERDDIIIKMQKRESIIDSLLMPIKSDTTSVVYFYRDEKGTIISYRQLDSLCNYYQKQNAMQDFIILTAKKKFNFDYKIAQHGDTLLLDIWDKKFTIQTNEYVDFSQE